MRWDSGGVETGDWGRGALPGSITGGKIPGGGMAPGCQFGRPTAGPELYHCLCMVLFVILFQGEDKGKGRQGTGGQFHPPRRKMTKKKLEDGI